MTLKLYTPAELLAYADTLSPEHPTEEHIRLHRTWTRLSTNEQLNAAIADAEWLLRREADDDSDPVDIRENSRLNQLAVIAAARRELEFRSQRGLARPAPTYGISRAYLDDLKGRVRIEDEIDLAIGLRRRGSVMAALCPFHDDHNPSLIVWPESQRWHCFACNIGGDVLTWAQAWLKTDFRGAVTYLSARAGIPLPDRRAAHSSLRTRAVSRG